MKFNNFFKENNLIPREQQIFVLETLEQKWDDYKYFALNLPTGIGKTYIATSIANECESSYILTSSLQLQDQYQNSWKNIINVKGKSNYSCQMNNQFTCANAPCNTKNELKKYCGLSCDYYSMLFLASKSKCVLSNPIFMLYSVNYGYARINSDKSLFKKRDVLIFDEAHLLEDIIINFSEINYDILDICEKYPIKLKECKFSDDNDNNIKIVEKTYTALNTYAEELKSRLNKLSPPIDDNLEEWFNSINNENIQKTKTLYKKIEEIEKYIQPISIFLKTYKSNKDKWFIKKQKARNAIHIAPIYGGFLIKEYFGHLADKFIFMSATLGTKKQLSKELDIKELDIFYIEQNSPFPSELSPIISTPMISLSRKTYNDSIIELPSIIEKIINHHKNERGIIHSVTYDIASKIYENISNDIKPRLIYKDMELKGYNGQIIKKQLNNDELFRIHERKSNGILMSPSMVVGIDLKDDLSRWQIIVKMPWPFLGDERIAYKSSIDQDWYTNKMWTNIMQMCGRSTRNETDSSKTYILDKSFDFFYKKWQCNLPEWFKNRIVIF